MIKPIYNLLVIFFLTFLGHKTFCQNESNIWYFGNHAGLDFNNGDPVVNTESKMSDSIYYYSSAILCDPKTGALKFYSDGISVWDRNHNKMPNGHTLKGGGNGQTTLIVPFPSSPNRYYLFTLASDPLSNSYQLFWHLINLELNNGLGDVESSEKDKLLQSNLTAKLTAIPHQNNVDFWIIAHEHGTNNFVRFLLSSIGISEIMEQSIGDSHLDVNGNGISQGYIKASPNGLKVAVTMSGAAKDQINLFDFDNNTGQMFNYIPLKAMGVPYGVSFSANNSKLYVSFRSINAPDLNEQFNAIYQYDLSVDDINESIVGLIGNNVLTNIDITQKRGGPDAFSLQLAPDGRIYSGYSWLSPEVNQGDRFLIVIDKPNLKGIDCLINLKQFNFGQAVAGPLLPNFIESSLNGIESRSVCDDESSVTISPNPTFDKIKLAMPIGCDSAFNVEIYNSLGQSIIAKQNLSINAEIDIQNLSAGIYFLIISTDYNSNIVKRVFKK